MYGIGLLRGLGITVKHFVDTYTADLKWLGQKYTTPVFEERQGTEAKGIFTVEYPDEKIAVPERFRFVPFLVVNNYDDPYAPGDDWCTSCGICAKVCPPQCIWIVRGTDPETGRPKPQPEAFYIDIDICMNCGYCAEYCPFDAIKMDHDYELASYDRTTNHIYDKKQLSKEFRYWQTLAPTRIWEEAQDRGHWEHKDVEKLAKKAGVTLPPPTEENIWRATTVLPTEQAAAASAAAPAGTPQVAAPAAAPASFSDDPLVVIENESLPLEIQAAAALQVKNDSSIKLVSANRKAISRIQKAAKAAGTTIEELSAKVGGWEQARSGVAAAAAAAPRPAAPAPAAAAPAPAQAAPAAVAPASFDMGVLENNPLALLMDNAQPFEVRAAAAVRVKADKSIKLASENRKAISAVQKEAKERGTTIEEVAESFNPEAAAAARPTPEVVEVEAAPVQQEATAPTPAPAESSAGAADGEIMEAKELERKGKAKEIKLTGEDRKRIARAKAAAQEQGLDWDSL